MSSRYMRNAKDFVHCRLQDAIRAKEQEVIDAACKVDPNLKKYDALMGTVRAQQNALEVKHNEERRVQNMKLEPLIAKARAILDPKSLRPYDVRSNYVQKTFSGIFDKYRKLQRDAEEALILHDQKDLAAFLDEWLKKLD